MRDAFAPVGLMLDYWGQELPAGSEREFEVVVINDRDEDWTGTVHLHVSKDDQVLSTQQKPCTIGALDRETLSFAQTIPAAPGDYTLTAELTADGEPPVRSVRDAKIVKAM